MTAATVRRIRWAVAGGTVALVVGAFLWLHAPGPAPHHYSADLANASELVKDNAVRLRDVEVGKVTSIKLDGLHAKVGFTVARDVHLPSATRVEVRQTSLLGELYLEVVPGGTGRLRDGATIPLGRTRRGHELEQVVSLGSELVDKLTVDNVNNIIHTFDHAFEGDPNRIGRFLDAMTGATAAFDAHKDQLAATIEKVEQLSASLAPHTQELAHSVDQFAAGLRALDTHKDKLAAFTTGLRQLSETAAKLLVANESKLSKAGAQSRQLLGEIVGNLTDFERGLQALPDFNNGWRCTVQGHWIQFLAGVYPEVARLDTGSGHCPPPDQGPRAREEQGQVQVTGVPSQHVDDPAHTGDVDLGAGSANGNTGRSSSARDDGGLGTFMWSTAGRWAS